MKKTTDLRFVSGALRSCLCSALALCTPLLVCAQTAEQTAPTWYVQAALGSWAVDQQSMQVNLGGAVAVAGTAQYTAGSSGALAFGRQTWTEWKDGAPVPVRLEVEGWRGTNQRRAVDLGMLHLQADDKVQVNALFLNGWIRLHRSEEMDVQQQALWSLWLGAGTGYASIKYPEAAVSSGCHCLKATHQSGVAWQLKLGLERQLSNKTRLVAQWGQVFLPAVNSAGDALPRTEYARLKGPVWSLGLRTDWR